jgi:alpha-D-ribose 1-methylphosphonate 5-triphosphate synthase subunit PhnH
MSAGETFIAPGFSELGPQSQAVFRALLSAMSEPGRVLGCPALIENTPMPPVLAAVALTLLDFETPVFLAGGLASKEARAFLSFHTGAPIIAEPAKAIAILAQTANELPPIPDLNAGMPDYPDRSATVIVGVSGFETGVRVSLCGPGVRDLREFCAEGLSTAFWEAAAVNAARFPLGADFVFCGPRSLAALPRSTLSTILAAR